MFRPKHNTYGFRNLVSNAIKFTNNSGKIVISSRVYDSYVEVLVKDSGIGIAEEDLEKLFKLEVDTSTIGNSVEKGTGLGLILCKEFVELNNGKIYAESDLNNRHNIYIYSSERKVISVMLVIL